jgi:hypothetical protein
MGSNLAHDLVENVIDIRQSIGYHLRGNHYPPVPLTMVEPCIEAIYAVDDGDTHKSIQLPKGIFWKGYPTAPAYAIVEAHHLEPWLNNEED